MYICRKLNTMNKRIQLLKDYASTTYNTWIVGQLILLEKEIENEIEKAKLQENEDCLAILKGNKLVSEIKTQIK